MASVKREVPCIHLYFAFKPRQKPRKCLSLGRPSCIWSLGRYRYHVLCGRGNTEPPTKHRQFDGVTAWMLLFEQQHAVPSATEKDISQSSFDGAIYLWSALSSPESMKHNWNFLQGPNRSTWRAVYLLFIFESSHIWQPKTIGKCSRCEQRHDERVVGSRKHEIGRIEAFFKEKCTGSVCFSGCLMLWLEDLPSGRLVWRTWLAPGVSHCGLKCT